MSIDLGQQLSKLQDLHVSIRQKLEVAELLVPEVNRLVASLFAIGLLQPEMILGEILHEYRNTDGAEDSSVLVVGALGVGHGGVGVVFFDALDYADFRENNRAIGGVILLNFAPFQVLPSGIRGLLLAQVQPLVAHAIKLIRTQ